MRNYFAIFRKIIIFALWYSAICWICSHTLRGCVDWNYNIKKIQEQSSGHTLRGCVDWNFRVNSWFNLTLGHTLRGCVDWNSTLIKYIADDNVTPFVGVWIETSKMKKAIEKLESHPSWVCGLKQSRKADTNWLRSVTPFVGVWIETQELTHNRLYQTSHPSWVCGLKHSW